MFGHKRRHDEIIEQLEQNRASCKELAKEINDLKECMIRFDISHILETMDAFIDSATYITHLIDNATIEDFPDTAESLIEKESDFQCHAPCDGCTTPNGE